MPRPPPGLTTALKVLWKEGLSRLSNGTQAPAQTARDLTYRQTTARAVRNVIKSVTKPLPSAVDSIASSSGVTSGFRSAFQPRFDVQLRSYSSRVAGGASRNTVAAPLRRGAHLGGSPSPFPRSSLPKTAQVGLQLHARGLHAGPARQVLQNVVENAPLGTRALWEVEWKKQKEVKRGHVAKKSEKVAGKENGIRAGKIERIPIRETGSVSGATTFADFFPSARPGTTTALKATSLLHIPLSAPVAESADWSPLTSPAPTLPPILSHPLLPPSLLRSIRSHTESSLTHSMRLRSLFAKLEDPNVVFDAWLEADSTLVVRADRAFAEEILEGRRYWLRVEDEAPVPSEAEERQEGRGAQEDRIHKWLMDVAPNTVEPGMVVHDLVASRVVLPILG